MKLGDLVETTVSMVVTRPSLEDPSHWDHAPLGTMAQIIGTDGNASVLLQFGEEFSRAVSHWRGCHDVRVLSALEILARQAP